MTRTSRGQRIRPGSPEEAALRAWIDRLAALKGDDLAKALRYREEDGSERVHVALRGSFAGLLVDRFNPSYTKAAGGS